MGKFRAPWYPGRPKSPKLFPTWGGPPAFHKWPKALKPGTTRDIRANGVGTAKALVCQSTGIKVRGPVPSNADQGPDTREKRIQGASQ